MDKNKYKLRIEKQMNLLEKQETLEEKVDIQETIIWLYEEHTKELERELKSYKEFYSSQERKDKLKNGLKRKILEVIDNY